MSAALSGFVITRPDNITGRSVPLARRHYDSLDKALSEAVRLNKLRRYSKMFLMVDCASAYTKEAS